MVTNFYGIFKCCWLKNTFEHTVLYALAIWFGAMNAANAGTGDETLPRYSGEAFNSGVIHILPNDIVINSKIVVSQNSSIEIQLNNYNISAELDATANHLFLVENDGVLILSGKEPAAEEIKTADKNSVTAGNNADILNVNGGLVKLSNITLKDSKTAAIITNSAIFQTINASFTKMNSGAVKNAGNATFSGKNDFVNNSVATGNGGALNLEKESETKFSDSSLFENNSAAKGNGGAIYGDGSLYFGDQNKLVSAVFTNNTAIDGGAVFVDENGKFIGYGEFIFGPDAGAKGNVATNSGGAIYNKGQMAFVGFNAKETKSIMFAANKATDGGAIYNTGALNLNGQQSFVGNSALYNNSEDDTKGFGGAIYNTGTLDIYGTDVKFSNNTAQKAGGAIYNNGGVVNISGSGILFNNNEVLETGKVDFVNWKNDAKEGFGGAIANMEGSRLNISGNVTFSENGKDSKISGGGAVYNRGYMTISGTRITEDGRDTTDSYNHAVASILFKDNVASKGIGGAIEAKGSHSGKNTVALSVIRGVNFIGNNSNADNAGDSRAGAIRANNDSITILDNVVFKGNSSRAAGGAISTANNLKDSALGTFISISNAYFEGNSVDMRGADGGAIRTGGALSMTNVQFVNNENKKDLDGAALSFDGTSLLLVADNGNVLFKGNIAKKGYTDQSSSGIHIDGRDKKKIMFNAGNGGEVVFFDKIVNAGTEAGANLTLELNKSNVLNATSTQLEQIYAKFFDAGGAYIGPIGPNARDEMQKTILGADSVYWLSKEEAAADGRLEEWNNLHEVEGIKTAPTDGKIIFNTQISNTSLNLHNGELLLADEITKEIKDKPYITGNSNLNLYGGKLDVSNNNIESEDQLAFNEINVEGETELNLDIDIFNKTIDYLGKKGITGTDKGKLVISEIGILNEAPTSFSLGDGSKLFKFTGSNDVKTELSKMTQVIVTSKAGYYFTLDKVDGSAQNNAIKLYKVLSGGGLGVALDSGSEFGISMKQSGGVETVNWAEKYDIYDPKTGKTYSNMVGTNVQKGAVFTLKGEKESVVKAGDGANNKVGIVAGTKKFGTDGKVYTLAMNKAANDIKDRETSAGRNTWYTYNKDETTGIRKEGAKVADMSGTTGQNLNISNIKFEGFKTAITNYETGVVNLENVGFSSNALDIYNLGKLNLKGENTFTNGIGGKDSLGKMSIINGKTISNSEINQQNVTINDIASLTVDADHLKSVTTNNGELNLGKGTLAYEVTGAGKTYISAGTEENKTKFSLADNVTIEQNSFSVLKNANAENVKGGKIIAKNIKIAESGALSTKVGEHLQGNIDNHGTLTLYGSGDKSVTELFNNALVDSYGEKTGKLVIDENANIKATEKINQNTIVNNGTFYADINKLAIEDKNSGIINDGVLYLNGSATNEAAAQNNLITTVSGNGVLYLSNNVVNTQNITQKEIHLIDKANVEAENDSSLKAKIKLDEGTKLAIKAENLISNKPSDEIDENWIDVENEGSLDLIGNLLDVVIGKAEDKENGGLVNINSSISFGENGEIRNNTVNINNDGVGLTVNADKITNSVIYVNDNSLTLTGGTLNSNVNGGKTNINGDVVLASSSNIASSVVNVAENKSLTIAAGRSWNNAISGKGTTIFGADFDGNNNAVIETLLINNGVLTSNTANIKGNVSNNNKLTLNGNNDVFNNTITGSGDLTLNGVMTANKTISQKSITNNGTLNSSIDNLNGELINTNTGIFNVAGANVVLNKNIAGEGTTVLENEAILKFGDSGKIEGVLKTNGATLDLQDTANKYTDVKIGAISGDLKLKIDADLSNASSDALELTSSNPSNGNIILSSINVQKDGDKSVTFLKGNTSGITSKLDTASTITNDYTYTFGISGNNKLDVLSAVLNTKPNTLKDFVTGNLAISANTYSMTKDISITSAENDNFGTTAGANTELNLNLNGHNLYGTLNGAKKDGIAVGNGYTLNINGTDGTVRGNISGFDNALKVENGGTLNIANTVLNNDTDINNQGTLYADNIRANKVLTASNAVIKNSNITDLENKGTAALKGTNALTNITETGNLIVNDGKTTVLGKLEQNRVTVANNAVLEAVLDKFVVSSNTINNGVLNLFGNGAINKDITGNGSLNLGGIVDNNAAVTQKDLTLASGKFTNFGTISFTDSVNINGNMTNNGSVSAKDLIVSGNFANKANAAINGVLTLKENAAATAENNGVITGGVIVENNRILINNNLVSGKVNVVNNGKILGNSGVMNITETSENNGEINQHKFTISNTGGFVNKGVLISAVLENNNNLINSNKITAAMLKNNGNIDNTSGTIEGVITNENIINGGKIIANDGSVNNKTINADLTSKGKFTNKGNIAGTITNTGSFKNAGIIKGNVTNNGDLTSAIENIMGTVINNGTYKTSGGIMNYDINGAGNTEINGNVVMGAGMFGINQSVNITAGSLLDIGAKTISVNDLKLNGTLGLEITSIANKSSDYVGGKLLVNNADLSGGKIQFTVDQGLLNKKEQTGDLSIIGLKSGASGSVVGDLTKVFEKNNRYEIMQGTKNGTVIIKNIASSSDVASLVGNRNNRNTAAAWENATLTSGTEAADIQKALDRLSQHNAQGYRRALNELAPSDSQMNLETVRLVQNIIGRETGKRFEKGEEKCGLYRPASMWVKGIGASHYMDNRSAAQGFNADTAGYVMGYDGNVDCDTSVGFGYAYTNTDTKGNINSRKSSISAQNMFVYGKYQPTQTYIRGAFIYGLADYDDKTSVAGYGISSKYNIHSVGAETALGHEYQNGLNPETGLRYTHLMPNDYTDSIGQKVENENITAISAFAKLKYKAEVKTDNQILFKPAIYIGANYDLNNSSHKINVAVANSRYTISSEPMSRFGFNGGLELAVSHDNVDLILGYDLNLHTKYNAHSGQIQFRYNF